MMATTKIQFFFSYSIFNLSILADGDKGIQQTTKQKIMIVYNSTLFSRRGYLYDRLKKDMYVEEGMIFLNWNSLYSVVNQDC